MRRHLLLFLAFSFLIPSVSLADENLKVFGGFSTVPLSISKLQDVQVSDWENFGLGGSEGRVALPLSAGNTSGMKFGVRLGALYRQSDDMDWLADLGIHFGGATALTLAVGVDYAFYRTENFRLSAVPRIGLIAGTIDLGTSSQMPGYMAPVITPQGTFADGSAISASIAGLLLGAGVAGTYNFTKSVGLRVDLGFQYGLMGGLTIKAGDVTLDGKAAAVTKADKSPTQAGLDPSASSLGLAGVVALVVGL